MQRIDVKVSYVSNKVMVTLRCNLNKGSRDRLKASISHIYLQSKSWRIKTESTRKLRNFNFQWTKTLYHNNLKNIAFFFYIFQEFKM